MMFNIVQLENWFHGVVILLGIGVIIAIPIVFYFTFCAVWKGN